MYGTLLGARWAAEPLAEGGGKQREREHAQACALLRKLLNVDTLRLEHNASGAPFLPDHPSLSVSISHCRRAVAVAVCHSGPVGIDIESRRRVGEALLQRVCSPDELDAIRLSDDPSMCFLRLWTRKEAVLKCRGTGIRGYESLRLALADSACSVADIVLPIPDVVAALAVGHPSTKPGKQALQSSI